MSQTPGPNVSVQVVPITGGRQIGWGAGVTEQLSNRLADLQEAIAAGGRAISESLPGIENANGWTVKQVTGTFAVTLTAEAGVILSRASAEATLEVSVTFEAGPDHASGA